jgi:hypothetical protein
MKTIFKQHPKKIKKYVLIISQTQWEQNRSNIDLNKWFLDYWETRVSKLSYFYG